MISLLEGLCKGDQMSRTESGGMEVKDNREKLHPVLE